MHHHAHRVALIDGKERDEIAALLGEFNHLRAGDDREFDLAACRKLWRGYVRSARNDLDCETFFCEEPVRACRIKPTKLGLWQPIQLQFDGDRLGVGRRRLNAFAWRGRRGFTATTGERHKPERERRNGFDGL